MRTEGIYTIMITLAIGMAFYYLAQQNYAMFNGFQGFSRRCSRRRARRRLARASAVLLPRAGLRAAGYFFVKYLLRAPFGVALQGMRDNPRRMSALGFNVTAHRVAAYAVAGVLAAVGGVLLVWYNGLHLAGLGRHRLARSTS